jgi:hypothetical protein
MYFLLFPNIIWITIVNHLKNSNLKIPEKFKDSLKSTIIGCICSLFVGYLPSKNNR